MGNDGRIMERWEVLCFDGRDESSSGSTICLLQALGDYLSFHTEMTLLNEERTHRDFESRTQQDMGYLTRLLHTHPPAPTHTDTPTVNFLEPIFFLRLRVSSFLGVFSQRHFSSACRCNGWLALNTFKNAH